MKKCVIFKDIVPGLSRTLSSNFLDFPGPWNFQEKNPGLSTRCENPESNSSQ